MESQKTITSKQRDLLDNIIALQGVLKESRLKTNGNINDNSLWEWMENSGSFLFLLKGFIFIKNGFLAEIFIFRSGFFFGI